MGILRAADRRTPGQRVDAVLATAAVVEAPVGTTSTVSEAVVRELDPAAAAAFGLPAADDSGPVTRTLAMRVPGIKRGRNLIAGTIGTLPLVCMRAGTEVPSTLLAQLDPRTTPAYTIAWTVDDLLFHGISWWRVTARDYTGYPVAVERLARERVQVQPATPARLPRVLVDGIEADDRDLIRFDALDNGLLGDGGPVVRLALALLRAGKRVADDDWSGLVLRLAEGADELTGDQITALLDEWEAARRERTTGFLNRAVDAEKISVSASDRQLTELSGLVASELARLLNLPASRIGAPQGSGMTYSNTESDRRDLVDTTLTLFMAPIAQRLSMGDVTPAGQRVGFDLTAYLRGTTTELVAAGAAAITAGITDAPEVRTRWLGLPPRTDLPTPAPAREDTPA